ncbi:murein transglycosylase [Rhodobacteraceae bacterium RKSG542]|uniref:murein transglycosylase A n=1 Tax=Pseudovibrio flavus TaxID=2529854 RepID=UPI0012BC9922|nr:MltA domain-containing protein [Pseudovibrio flavus]MTI18510.1 murein transglycosylase [Pseudovibrio flavus]
MKSHSIKFENIDGWAAEDHSAAFSVFMAQCKNAQSLQHFWEGTQKQEFLEICRRATSLGPLDDVRARMFFENHFQPELVDHDGFVTGYYQPEVTASLTPSRRFSVPLHGLPEGMKQLPNRAAVMDGALDGKGLELVWLESPADAFFIAIQGSARLRLEDGSARQLRFAGKSGHPYTPIGRILIERGEVSREAMSMQAIRDWLDANPDQRDGLLRQNESYIFFSLDDEDGGPKGGAGIPLTAMRSLAIDRNLHPYGMPIFVQTRLPWAFGLEKKFQRLMIAQDTGSAIVGPARGDIYTGEGIEAGDLAGRIKHEARFIVFRPKPILAGYGPNA